jgi:HD-GYP domain-containing protein (c-di-GMP phosphodiesterase class II)
MAKRLGDKLLEAGLISKAQLDRALAHQRITGLRLGDCLVECELLDETLLLRFLAAEFRTRYVTRERLAKVNVEPQVLDSVPVRLAEAHQFVPIAADFERRMLSVVMATPQNESLVSEICQACNLDEVVSFISTRAAIAAAIRRLYYAESDAFEVLHRRPMGRDVGPGSSARYVMPMSGAHSTQVFGLPGHVSERDYHEVIEVLVGHGEATAKRRGHSSFVSRLSGAVAEHLRLGPKNTTALKMAALLHDFGKPSQSHFSHLSIERNAPSRAEAVTIADLPLSLLESLRLTGPVRSMIAEQYESVDGSGLPQGLGKDEIHIGARILAVVDAFWELTRDGTNPLTPTLALAALATHAGTRFDPAVVDGLRSVLQGLRLRLGLINEGRKVVLAEPDAALSTQLEEALSHNEVLSQTVAHVDALQELLGDQHCAVLVMSTTLGLEPVSAIVNMVRGQLGLTAVPIIILGKPEDDVQVERMLLAGVSEFIPSPWTPGVVATTVAAALQRAVGFGAVGHVVRGSAAEIPLAEVVELLGNRRKSGRLAVASAGVSGWIHFEEGQMVYAQSGTMRGREAASMLLQNLHCDFEFDPEALLTVMPNITPGDFDF